jgi:hypothetical protein
MNNSKLLHDKLAAVGVRIFKMRLRIGLKSEEHYFVHDSKSVEEWRNDIRDFIAKSDCMDESGWADDSVFNSLFGRLNDLGYEEIVDIVTDVFEGRVTTERSSLVHDPDHDDIQTDGFGHHGWGFDRDE